MHFLVSYSSSFSEESNISFQYFAWVSKRIFGTYCEERTQEDSESPKSSKKNATNFLLLVMFSLVHSSIKVTEVIKITFFQFVKHSRFASAFVAFLKGYLISLTHWRWRRKEELLHTELFLRNRSFCYCREWSSPLGKKIQNRSALVSCNSFVRDNISNQIKLVRFGVGPQISFINKARI